MKIETIHIDALKPYERNAKAHPQDQVDRIARSIEAFGFRTPILVDADNTLIAGHGRLLAAQQLGLQEVPAIRTADLTPDQVRAFRIADNKTAESAWMDDILAAELQALAAIGFDVTATGFTVDELNTLTEQDIQGKTDPDAVPEAQDPPVTQLGDVYTLDRHRLVCGDCTDPSAVARLTTAPGQIHMMWTDPPYGVDYSSKTEWLAQHGLGTHRKEIQNDSKSPKDMNVFWLAAFSAVIPLLRPGAAYYIAGPHGSEHLLLLQATRDAGFLLKHTLIWVKNGMVLGRSDYHYQHEPILYGWKPGGPHYFQADYTATSIFDDDIDLRKLTKDELMAFAKALRDTFPSTVFRENKPVSSELHPTQKPVNLIARMIRNSTRPNPDQICLDPFLGSGSTLIACEKTGRTCYGMEIEPHYCDVIVKRWEEFTGKKARCQRSDVRSQKGQASNPPTPNLQPRELT